MKRKVPMWGRVSGTEICPELWTIVNESHGRRTQDGAGEVTRIQVFVCHVEGYRFYKMHWEATERF